MTEQKCAHLLGIAGMGMGSLAGMLKKAGYKVTGSDENIYPPMSDQLAAWGIPVSQGYSPDHLAHHPDVVVVGNVIRRTNPEAQAAIEQGYTYYSMPMMLRETFIRGKNSIVITGTHGKSTTTALTAQTIQNAGLDPSYLVGAAMVNHPENFAVGQGPHFIIEGDEYDTAFFDKVPKFKYYLPNIAVITSLEFDHADIYADVTAVENAFKILIDNMPKDGHLLIWEGANRARRLAANAPCKVMIYGHSEEADYRILEQKVSEKGLTLLIGGTAMAAPQEITTGLWGDYNATNICASFAACHLGGLEPRQIADAMAKYSGIVRRQELIGTAAGVTVMDDFAHHPTAIRVTIEGMRQRFPGRRIVAAYEPRSATACRKVMQDDLARALATADEVLLCAPFRTTIPQEERLDGQYVVDEVNKLGTRATLINKDVEVADAAIKILQNGDVFLCMSNGHFANTPRHVLELLKESSR